VNRAVLVGKGNFYKPTPKFFNRPTLSRGQYDNNKARQNQSYAQEHSQVNPLITPVVDHHQSLKFSTLDDENLVSVILDPLLIAKKPHSTVRPNDCANGATKAGVGLIGILDTHAQDPEPVLAEVFGDIDDLPELVSAPSTEESDEEEEEEFEMIEENPGLYSTPIGRFLRVPSKVGDSSYSPVSPPMKEPRYFFDDLAVRESGDYKEILLSLNLTFDISIFELEAELAKDNPLKYEKKLAILKFLNDKVGDHKDKKQTENLHYR